MWTSKEELDIERARDEASKLVVLGSALKAGVFSALTKEKNIGALARELHADERALYIMLEALCAIGYVNKRNERYVIADRARPLFTEQGDEYVGGSLPHFMDILKAWLLLPEIIKGRSQSILQSVTFPLLCMPWPPRLMSVSRKLLRPALQEKRMQKMFLTLEEGREITQELL